MKIASVKSTFAIAALFLLFIQAHGFATWNQQPGNDAGTSRGAAPGRDAGTSQRPLPPRSDSALTVLNHGQTSDIQRTCGVSASDAKLIVDHRPYQQVSDLKTVFPPKKYKRILKRIQANQP